jgi:hypothetical protein
VSGTAILADLRRRLERSRRDGLSFREAWPPAVQAVVARIENPDERAAWADVLSGDACGGESHWRRAYDLEDPTKQERAIGALLDADRTIPVPFGECERCRAALPPPSGVGSSRLRRFCSDSCRKRSAVLLPVAA